MFLYREMHFSKYLGALVESLTDLLLTLKSTLTNLVLMKLVFGISVFYEKLCRLTLDMHD